MDHILKKLFLVIATGLYSSCCFAHHITAYSAEDLVKRVSSPDTTYIVNFWATWCIPCVSELPEFAKLYDHYRDQPVKIIMVSFNLQEEYPDILEAYVAKKNIRQEVIWMSDSDIDHYRSIIDDRWSGQIPSTIIFDNRREHRYIIEEVTTAEEIERLIE